MIIFLLLLIVIILGLTFWITYFGLRSRTLSKKTKTFMSKHQGRKKTILMVGDSIMRGVGTSHNRHSLPGLVMSHASTKGVTVYAKDGARCHEVLEVCKELPRKEFSQVILFCGGMDIIYFSRANFIEKNLQELFLHAKSLSPHVIYISPADVGKAPIFIFPVSYIYTYRSRKFLSISRECAEKCGVTFVDYCNSVNKYYAEDKSHPNDNGYRNLFNLFKHHIVE